MRTHLVSHVPHCDEHGKCVRNDKYDAYFCVACDEWAEKQCSDSECTMCAPRPAKPSEVKPQAALSLIVFGDKILCVWNRRYNGWGLPGGKMEPDETLLEAQARELREETGLQTKEATMIYSAPTVTSDSGRMVHIFKVVLAVDHVATPFELEPGSPVDFRSREELLTDSPFKAFYEAMFKHLDRTVETPK